MSTTPSLLEMLKSGVHFGHKASKWHPKMKPYIYGVREGIHIIDLEKSAEKFQEALDFVKGVAAQGGIILFVGTKLQAKEIVKNYAEKMGMPYITERWLGGTFTNFSTISKLTSKLKRLVESKEKGELGKYTKKEQLKFGREIEKLQSKIGGIKDLRKLPEAIFVVDIAENKIAVREAKNTGIPVIAMVDTNNNPEKVDYPIPANNDAIRSIEIVISSLAEAIEEGKKDVKVEVKRPAAR